QPNSKKSSKPPTVEKPPGKKKKVAATVSTDPNRVIGVFRRMGAGHGYVRPAATPRSLGKTQDVYIADRDSGDASSGDTVLVKIVKSRRPGREGLQGEVLEIVERETHQFVGLYFEQSGQGYVQ